MRLFSVLESYYRVLRLLLSWSVLAMPRRERKRSNIEEWLEALDKRVWYLEAEVVKLQEKKRRRKP